MDIDELIKISENLSKEPYPITITQARYGGTYEGASWLAFHNYAQDVPWPAFADDMTCSDWWSNNLNTRNVGRGHSPDAALRNLLIRLT